MKDSKNKTFVYKGIETEAKYYRPVSLFHLISTVIEKSVHNQTL